MLGRDYVGGHFGIGPHFDLDAATVVALVVRGRGGLGGDDDGAALAMRAPAVPLNRVPPFRAQEVGLKVEYFQSQERFGIHRVFEPFTDNAALRVAASLRLPIGPIAPFAPK